MNHLKAAGTLLASMLLVACKVQITVPEGGRVVSMSGTYSCESGQTCEIDIADTLFNERFEPQAAPGYVFDKWKRAQAHLCGDSKSSCPVSTLLLANYPQFLAFLDADLLYYLEPEFVPAQSGGAAWLYQAVTCKGWNQDGTGGTTNDPDKIGLSLSEINTEGQDCSDVETVNFEESRITFEPRISSITPPITESVQCPDDPGCGSDRETVRFTYQGLQSQGTFVDRVSRIDTYTRQLGLADDNEGIDEALTWAYEQGSQSLRRPIEREAYGLTPHPDTGEPVLTMIERASWSYNADGSVTQVNLSIYDEDSQEYLTGRIRYTIESDGLAATTEVDFEGQTFTTGKIVYHDRGILDTPTPPLTPPPTGQIETENGWELPENYTEYTMGDDFQLVPESKQEITSRSRTGDLPIEVLTYGWDALTETWQLAEKVEVGYRLDGENTLYRSLELYYYRENGNWVKNFLQFNLFRRTPYETRL